MDDLKLYARSECQLDSLIQSVRIFSNDIGMKFASSMLRLWEHSWVDDQGKNCPYNERPRERHSGRKLPPHNLFTCNVEVANRDNI